MSHAELKLSLVNIGGKGISLSAKTMHQTILPSAFIIESRKEGTLALSVCKTFFILIAKIFLKSSLHVSSFHNIKIVRNFNSIISGHLLNLLIGLDNLRNILKAEVVERLRVPHVAILIGKHNIISLIVSGRVNLRRDIHRHLHWLLHWLLHVGNLSL